MVGDVDGGRERERVGLESEKCVTYAIIDSHFHCLIVVSIKLERNLSTTNSEWSFRSISF